MLAKLRMVVAWNMTYISASLRYRDEYVKASMADVVWSRSVNLEVHEARQLSRTAVLPRDLDAVSLVAATGVAALTTSLKLPGSGPSGTPRSTSPSLTRHRSVDSNHVFLKFHTARAMRVYVLVGNGRRAEV